MKYTLFIGLACIPQLGHTFHSIGKCPRFAFGECVQADPGFLVWAFSLASANKTKARVNSLCGSSYNTTTKAIIY